MTINCGIKKTVRMFCLVGSEPGNHKFKFCRSRESLHRRLSAFQIHNPVLCGAVFIRFSRAVASNRQTEALASVIFVVFV